MRRTVRILGAVTVAGALLLAACGGSGGGEAVPAGATLSALVPSEGALAPGFDPGTFTYDVPVGLATPWATVTPTTTDPSATVTVNGIPATSGAPSAPIPLAYGANPATVEVTAPGGGGTATYTVLFDTTAGGQEAYVKAPNTGLGGRFGGAVAISGDTMVVGAPGEDGGATGVNGPQGDTSAPESGAAYVFVRSGGTWTQQAYLKASNTDARDWFGSAVAISGDTIVVGAPQEDSAAIGIGGDAADDTSEDAGAAYVFVRSGTTWTQQAYLKASNTGAGDYFGTSVGISGDTIVVGARYEDSPASGIDGFQGDDQILFQGSGATYVFVRSGTAWTQQAYIKASNPGWGDMFGWSLAVSGDTVVVGALHEDSGALGVNGVQADETGRDSGAAYVFVRSGTAWTQQAYLKASNAAANDSFGIAVAASGDTIVVGAMFESSGATGVNGDESDSSAPTAGAAYVFVRSGTTWTQQAYLKASNTGTYDQFGLSVAVSGDAIVVGTMMEGSAAVRVNGDGANDDALDSGAAYLFVRSGTTWAPRAYLKASNTEEADAFGWSVAISGDTVVVGAGNECSSATGIDGDQTDNSAWNSGAAYVFR